MQTDYTHTYNRLRLQRREGTDLFLCPCDYTFLPANQTAYSCLSQSWVFHINQAPTQECTRVCSALAESSIYSVWLQRRQLTPPPQLLSVGLLYVTGFWRGVYMTSSCSSGNAAQYFSFWLFPTGPLTLFVLSHTSSPADDRIWERRGKSLALIYGNNTYRFRGHSPKELSDITGTVATKNWQ